MPGVAITTSSSAVRLASTRCAAFRRIRTVSHTCRAIHILQALLGSVDCPGGWRYKAPFPKPIPPGIKAAWPKAEAGLPLDGPPLGFPRSPEDLIVDQHGDPLRVDKAFSWEHPLALHGMMHMVLHNAANHDPYGIDVLFMFMANMAWNSSMNIPETLGYFTKKREDGEYVIPKIIYSDAFYSETVPYCDLILPDTTYLERWDCISMLDRPISSAHGGGDAIRQPVLPLDRDVRPFQTVLLDIGARLGLPGMTKEDGSPKFPGGYEDYIVNHERAPGCRSAVGLARRGREQFGRRRGQSRPTDALHRKRLLLARGAAALRAVHEVRQSRVPATREEDGVAGPCRTDYLPTL